MLSDPGWDALETVRTRIAQKPENYEQDAWGNTHPDCDTPGCIAGHIIARVASAREGYKRRMAEAHDPGDERVRDDAIRDAATEALGLTTAPQLFDPRWPPNDREGRGKSHPVALEITGPMAEDAILVLDAVLSGRLNEALEPSAYLYGPEDEAAAEPTAEHPDQ